MIAIVGRLLAPYALKLIGLGAILAAVSAVLLGARQAGRNAERGVAHMNAPIAQSGPACY